MTIAQIKDIESLSQQLSKVNVDLVKKREKNNKRAAF
jgi:hypothetical protein